MPIKINPFQGWWLIYREDSEDIHDWNIAWLEPFNTKKEAIAFARENKWQHPYKAVRGKITVKP